MVGAEAIIRKDGVEWIQETFNQNAYDGIVLSQSAVSGSKTKSVVWCQW
jgi:hypothetical protein